MWRKDMVELLIKRYKEHENLYNTNNPHYLDREKRSRSLFEIREELKKYDQNITVEDIKKKIHTLRAQYIKQCKEIVSSKQNNVCIEEEYEPKLWCFDKLEFLKEHCGTRKPIPVIQKIEKCNQSDVEETIDMEDESTQTITASINNKPSNTPTANVKKINVSIEERVDNVKTLLVTRLMEKKDYDWFGKLVVFEINSLKDESLRRDTVWKIQSILREAYLMDNEPSSQECNTVFQF